MQEGEDGQSTATSWMVMCRAMEKLLKFGTVDPRLAGNQSNQGCMLPRTWNDREFSGPEISR